MSQEPSAGAPPAARGFLGLDPRGWPGTIAVALVVAAHRRRPPRSSTTWSRPSGALPAGSVVDVGRGVSFVAADGWSLDAETSAALGDAVRLDKGGLSLSIQAVPAVRPLPDEYARLADEIRHTDGAQLFNDTTTFTTDAGLAGIGGSWASAESEGRFAVFQGGDTTIRLVAKGPPDAMASGVDDLERMAQTLRVEGP